MVPRVYQEYLAKTLTDKCNHTSRQMDKLVNEANSELDKAGQEMRSVPPTRLFLRLVDNEVAVQSEHDRLREENAQLVAALREKTRKHQQTQELYDRLKRKEITAATQSAAFNSVDEALGHTVRQTRSNDSIRVPHIPETPGGRQDHHVAAQRLQHSPPAKPTLTGAGITIRGGEMAPPALPRLSGGHPTRLGHGESPESFQRAIDDENEVVSTHSGHQDRRDPLYTPETGFASSAYTPGGMASRISPQRPANQHRLRISPNARAGLEGYKGYGMSAGMKSGQIRCKYPEVVK